MTGDRCKADNIQYSVFQVVRSLTTSAVLFLDLR